MTLGLGVLESLIYMIPTGIDDLLTVHVLDFNDISIWFSVKDFPYPWIMVFQDCFPGKGNDWTA